MRLVGRYAGGRLEVCWEIGWEVGWEIGWEVSREEG